MTPVPAELLERGVSRRWVLAYAAFLFMVVSLACSLFPALQLHQRGLAAVDPADVLGIGASASLIALVTTVGVVWGVRRQLRRSLGRWLGSDAGGHAAADVVLLAPAYLQGERGRYRRRVPGALVVTATHVAFVASLEKQAERDLSWPLREVESVVDTPDRFGAVSRIFDIQGAIRLQRGDEEKILSVIGCRAFSVPFGEVWGRALATG